MILDDETYKKMKEIVLQYEQNQINEQIDDEEQPYIIQYQLQIDYLYNPNYGDDRECVCGHPYYRHFDPYENNEAVGCKYCQCWQFEEKIDVLKDRLNKIKKLNNILNK